MHYKVCFRLRAGGLRCAGAGTPPPPAGPRPLLSPPPEPTAGGGASRYGTREYMYVCMYVCMYVYSPPPSLQPLSLQPGAGWPAGPSSPTRIAATRKAASAARPLRAGGARAAGAYAAADRRRGRQSETAVEQRSKSPSTAVTVKRPLTAATVKRRRNGQTAAKGRRSPGPGGPKPLRDSTHPLGDSASKSSRCASINSLSSKCRLAQARRTDSGKCWECAAPIGRNGGPVGRGQTAADAGMAVPPPLAEAGGRAKKALIKRLSNV